MTSTARSSAQASEAAAPAAEAAIEDAARKIAAQGESAPRHGRDPVNQAMVNNWVEALGDGNPVYTDPGLAASSVHGGLVAPPAMVQVWTMGGLHAERATDDPLQAMMTTLDEAGFTSVVATNSEQTYHRYLRPGEHVSLTSRLESVVGPKRTGLGEGWFVTTHNTWYAGDEAVAEMRWRVLKFRPSTADSEGKAREGSPAEVKAQPRTDVLTPVRSRDTAFFWDGTAGGELRIQRCAACGLLRHPPGPMCPSCGATSPDYVVAAGAGEVYSYVVHHHPPMPGRELPFVVALVELAEGVRVLGELLDVAPEDVRVGMPVEVTFLPVDDNLALPAWRPAGTGRA
jgi:uncharacterized OB-fold protein